ncbi:MAG: hypothetical protein PHW52_01765 [Candidatus Pacebacteria bacterium]|nr:hypothetical protein [Candidatus Paceibacterota bacterium]
MSRGEDEINRIMELGNCEAIELIDSIMEEAMLDRVREVLPMEDSLLVSELLLDSKENDCYRKELDRRFRILCLSDEQISHLSNWELSLSDDKTRRKEKELSRFFSFFQKDDLPKPAQLYISELVCIVERAGEYYCKYGDMSEDCRVTLDMVIGNRMSGSPYRIELLWRLGRFGFSEQQMGAFIRNESLVLRITKWAQASEDAWTR